MAPVSVSPVLGQKKKKKKKKLKSLNGVTNTSHSVSVQLVTEKHFEDSCAHVIDMNAQLLQKIAKKKSGPYHLG